MNSFGATKVNASFYVWVDMPGATKETVSVRVKDGSVLFAGEAEMDSNQVESGRTYDGSFGPFDMSKLGDIKAEVNYGVLKMLINYRK
nr:heat shock 22 kda protein, mitochondrial [Quercus suber]